MSDNAFGSQVLRGYQRVAVDRIGDLWSAPPPAGGAHRVVLESPCGTGKTLMELTALLRYAPTGRAVLFAPTVALLTQLARAAAALPHEVVAVCGRAILDPADPGAADQLDADPATAADVAAAGASVTTTDPQELAGIVRARTGPLLILSTYTSAPVVAEATATVGIRWDVVICDEAHRTAGLADKAWALPVDDDRLPARRRLFATATPRQVDLNPALRDEAGEALPVLSMTDITRYGPTLSAISLRTAIDQGDLQDYRIAVIAVSRDDAAAAAEQAGLTGATGAELRVVATQLAMLKAAADPSVQARRILAFSNTIARSRRWARTLEQVALHAPERLAGPVRALHVDGTMPADDRHRILDQLAAPGRDATAVVSNCRVLAEGIDLPTVDAVVFADPRRGHPDIVQIVGRALRPHPDRHQRPALIVLPILVDPGEDVETVATGSDWVGAWQVITAMAHEDETLFRALAQARTQVAADQPPVVDDDRLIIDAAALPPDLATAFALRIITSTTSTWSVVASRMRDYQRIHGDTHPRAGLQLRDGYPIGQQAARARIAYSEGRLSRRVQQLFDDIPGWTWQRQPATGTRRTFDEWITLCRGYLTRTRTDRIRPHIVTQDGVALGRWVQQQAARYSRLNTDQRRQLTDTLGPDWRSW